jgi:DNA-binding CsgD family transcriptional regulator
VTVINIPVEIAGIATAASVCNKPAAQEMLNLIMSQRPFVASSIAVFNPLDGTHQTIASVGYSQRVLAHLNGWLVTDDIAYQYYRGQDQPHRSLKWAEMPFAYRDTHSVKNVFWPAGFREGITLRLHSRDGRYTGNLHISTDDPRYPTNDMMVGEVQCLQTILGNFADLLRSVSGQFIGKSKSGGGCVITGGGEVIGLPGIAQLNDSLRMALVEQFSQLGCDLIPPVFVFKHELAWFRVYTGLIDGGARAIVTEECETLNGLTERELEIIELLLTGATNSEIAANIFVARATVSKHLENIFEKLGCNSRTAVVAIALKSDLRRLPTLRSRTICRAARPSMLSKREDARQRFAG